MKSYLVVITMILCLILFISCTPNQYNKYIEAGNDAIHANDYDTAIMNYSKAITENETEEATTVYDMLISVQEGIDASKEGNYKLSVSIFTKIQETDGKIAIIDVIHRNVERLLKESEKNLTTYENLTKQLDEGNKLLGDNKFDDAIKIFNEVASTTTSNESTILNLISEAKSLSAKATENKKTYEEAKKAEAATNVKNAAITSDPKYDFLWSDTNKVDKNISFFNNNRKRIDAAIEMANNMGDDRLVGRDNIQQAIEEVEESYNEYISQAFQIAKESYPEFTEWTEGSFGENTFGESCIGFVAYSNELQGHYYVMVNDDGDCYARPCD